MSDRSETIKFLISVLGNENLVALTKAMKDSGAAGKGAEATDQEEAAVSQPTKDL